MVIVSWRLCDKNGHPIIPGDKKPDLIVHVPGEMERNLVVIEIKPVTVGDKDLKEDLEKLAWLLDKGKYHWAIMLVYGNGKSQFPKKIQSQITPFCKRWGNRILLAWHHGCGEEVELMTLQ